MRVATRTWPYRRAAKGRVILSPWVLPASGETPVGESLEGWDPSTPFVATRRIRVNVSGVREDCGLPPQASLRVVASWWCEGTTLRGFGSRVDLPGEGDLAAEAEVRVPASDLSDSIKLQVSLVLAERLPRKPVTAWAPGTVLWEESKDIRLEGSGSRFPMNAISFRNSGPDFPSSAAWRLEWDPDDLEVPALGGIRLHVNTDHAWMSRVIASPDDPSSRLVVSMMEFDVTRTLLVGALERDDFVQRKDWPPDSVGKVIERILKLRLREFSALVLQAKLRSSPDTFHALLQDKLGLLQRVP